VDADLTGEILGDFQIETVLGQGSMACVYEAQQVSLRRKVALKVLEEGIFTPGENIKRFIREAEALAILEHPNIVPVYAAGAQTPYYYFAMRLIRGGTLQDAMQKGIKRADALQWASDVCRGLAFAHAAGVVHRDLKPTNVLIHDGVALLSDFGLARLRDASTVTQMGHIIGTPLYMSPEQTAGEQAGPAADCFALGVILYELLTGRHPFVVAENRHAPRAERYTQLFRRIQRAEFVPPSHVAPDVSPLLEKMILRAMAPKPEDRFPDATAMLLALEAATQDKPGDDRVVQATQNTDESTDTDAGLDATAAIGNEALGAEDEAVLERLRSVRTSRSTAGPVPKLPFALNRYTVHKELGHGGQGVVYEAHDPVLDRRVALKVLRRDLAEDPQLEEMFWNEARTAARLSHPHIITIYDFGVEQKYQFLTMQLVDGPSLDRVMQERGPLPPAYAVQVAMQTAEALGFAHEAGVVHLDVKPGNILLQRSVLQSSRDAKPGDLGAPHALLSDFTMARAGKGGDKRRSGSPPLAGTVPYCSPEQLTSGTEKLSPASDLFSLGVVLHEMLTGKRLFLGENVMVSRQLVLSAAVPPPSTAAAGIPGEVDELCAKLLERPIEKRLQSAGEMLALAATALERINRM
jgi:serine/threonine-protein kinase